MPAPPSLSVRRPLWRDSASSREARPSTLLSIHTAMSAWHITQLMLVSLAGNRDPFDVVVIDDHSRLDIGTLASQWGCRVLRWGGTRPMGLTHSWNMAWQHAVEQNYTHLVIANNDLLVPDGTIGRLGGGLSHNQWDALIPTVSRRGSVYPGHTLNNQRSGVHRGVMYAFETADTPRSHVARWTDSPLHFADVSDLVAGEPVHRIERMNGYMMAFHVGRMRPYEFSPGKLFDPRRVNVGNEEELFKRVRGKARVGVMGSAFVFHFKGYTLTGRNRDSLNQTNGG